MASPAESSAARVSSSAPSAPTVKSLAVETCGICAGRAGPITLPSGATATVTCSKKTGTGIARSSPPSAAVIVIETYRTVRVSSPATGRRSTCHRRSAGPAR